MFDTHTTTVVPPDTIDRIERSMKEEARKEASAVAQKFISSLKMAEPSKTAGGPAEDTITYRAVESANSFTKEPPLRLEPTFAEVKQVMKDLNMSEKNAEKAVRKALLHNALYALESPRAIEIARALLALI